MSPAFIVQLLPLVNNNIDEEEEDHQNKKHLEPVSCYMLWSEKNGSSDAHNATVIKSTLFST